jgi:hypothetical protein
MIINPIICENCKAELQPSEILLGVENGELISMCAYCRYKINKKK